jgi:acyl transferase domain-containing protein
MSSVKSKPAGIAIVGMAGRFPKARNVAEFWQNLCAGTEGITFFTDEELAAAGVAVPNHNQRYIKARGVLDDADKFDAAFFGFNPKEAEVLDPQHRVFLECAWEALENAGCDPARFDGAIGVFAGMSLNTYLVNNLMSRPDVIGLVGEYQAVLSNDKDFLPTRVSYKLNLKGPSLNIQTACSTSLVAVCVACQHLLNHQCDAALAGAVSITFPQKRGYLYQEGGIASPDGHCRTFDSKAAGTVAGEGVGIVVLKRLADALEDGDQIDAVIKGFAINNDGAMKIGYTAPSVDGQAEAIAMAQEMAGVAPETISYVEAHGTGTPLGDPIEIEGLTKAFRAGTSAKNFCAIGSVKSSIGHLDTAAGVAGLIKTVLALQHQKLPPSLNFEAPNPKIDFANSPFHVNSKLVEWGRNGAPRRAGVSSFGIGGTNAHVVIEEAPEQPPSSESKAPQVLVLSAKTRSALYRGAANLSTHLQQNPNLNPGDVAFTLQTGRREFVHRRAVVCRESAQAIAALQSRDSADVQPKVQEAENPPIVFMFPGQGAQRLNMGRELYETELLFREQVDYCAEKLKPHLPLDLRTLLYPPSDEAAAATEKLTQTANAQPALFVIEYALARLWMSWGIEPAAMIGHSIGEYVAACVAGVFSLDDALALVAARGRMMQQMPPGAMLAVRLPENEVQPLLGTSLSLATVNGAALCVVSGTTEAVNELRPRLAQRNVACTLLHTSHAFHSPMMEPVVEPFAKLVSGLTRHAPKIPFVSNVTGTWITDEEATDPQYWARHLRQTVRFSAGAGELLQVRERVFLEVGPGSTLMGLAKQNPARNAKTLVVASLVSSPDGQADREAILNALGQMWMNGSSVNWKAVHGGQRRQRVHLPTYPFERKRFWVEPAREMGRGASEPAAGSTTSRAEENNGDANASQAAAGRDVPRSEDLAESATPADQIVVTLRAMFSELSGLEAATIESDVRFTELGFDSLFLTQASLAIEKRFGVQVAFRQLLTDFQTMNALAHHIAVAIEQSLVEEISKLSDEEAQQLVHGVN